jgi:hypothetical protein
MMRLIYILWITLVFAFVAQGEVATGAKVTEKNPLVWDASEISVDLPAMTNLVYFTFSVTNASATEATLVSTETSCECTLAEATSKLPWNIKPGEGGFLKVRMNTLGKFGLVTKTIVVHTSHGDQLLRVRVKIPVSPAPFNVSVRQQDMMAAKVDRQAVFHGNCAACHSLPTARMQGGICHISEHRAEMVPDLAKLNHETGADFWRTNIVHGKVGSLMPAFGKMEGGILETNQIESLVDYLVKRYPPPKK